MARPKGIIQKRNETKYWLPEGITLKEGQSTSYGKETKLIFIDNILGEFSSSFKAIQNANISTHPDAVKARRSATNLAKYGHENPGANKEVRNKAKATMVKLYGVEHALLNKDLLDKSKATLYKNFSATHPMYSEEIKETRVENNLKKYGVDNVMKVQEFKDSLIKTNQKLYGVANVMSKASIQEKHYESVLQWQRDIDRLNILPNGKTVSEFCREKSIEHPQHANRIFNQDGSDLCQTWIEEHHKLITSLELRFQRMLPEATRMNKKIHTNVPHRPDFELTCKGKTIYVDVDGLLFHSVKYKDKWYHFKKRNNYEKENLTLLQFHQDEVSNKQEIVKSIINSKLGKSNNRYFARKLTLSEIGGKEGSNFFKENHLMGAYPSAKHFALKNEEGVIVSCMSYKKNEDGIEISRFCSKLDSSVAGGLSKLLAHITKLTKPKKIIYFTDLRYTDGKSVQKLGFTLEKVSLGWRWTDGFKSYNRFSCRANMDIRRLSEKEYASELGWYKIFDAGQAKFVLNLAE